MQQSLLLLFLILAGIIALVFILVYSTSLKADQNQSGMGHVMQKRFWFILILLVVLGIFAAITIPRSPYFVFKDEIPAKVIHVASAQYTFLMSQKAFNPAMPEGDDSIVIAPNELVEFRVTSLDVTHGFAIYDPSHKIIAQTQAMPGYVNNLRFKFKEQGEYLIHCLEYCGSGHQVMRTSFTVK